MLTHLCDQIQKTLKIDTWAIHTARRLAKQKENIAQAERQSELAAQAAELKCRHVRWASRAAGIKNNLKSPLHTRVFVTHALGKDYDPLEEDICVESPHVCRPEKCILELHKLDGMDPTASMQGLEVITDLFWREDSIIEVAAVQDDDQFLYTNGPVAVQIKRFLVPFEGILEPNDVFIVPKAPCPLTRDARGAPV